MAGYRWVVLCALALNLGTSAQAREPRRVIRDAPEAVTDVHLARTRILRREASIVRLTPLLKAADSSMRPEMMLRLAALLDENGRDANLIAQSGYRLAYDVCFDAANCEADSVLVDVAERDRWWGKSIRLYRSLLTGYPTFSRADEAAYNQAIVLSLMERDAEAVEVFTSLVRLYPASDFAGDAFIQVGEYHYDQNRPFKALSAYRRAAQIEGFDRRDYALYMAGWAAYGVGDHDIAIDALKTVVERGLAAERAALEADEPVFAGLDLHEDAMPDLVRFFADAGRIEDAEHTFTQWGHPELIAPMLRRLAALQVEQGKVDSAIGLYRRLIVADPLAQTVAADQQAIYLATRLRGDRTASWAALDAFVATVTPQSPWMTAHSGPLVAEAQAALDTALLAFAVEAQQHSRDLLRDGRNPSESRTAAEQAYKAWILAFPEGENAHQAHYALGELLYAQNRWSEAKQAYQAVVDLNPNPASVRFCAKGIVHASIEAGELAAIVAAVDQFAQLFPDDDETHGMVYKAGHQLYESEDYAASADRFEWVIEKAPKTPEAAMAANLILDVLVLQENWPELAKRAAFFAEQAKLGDRAFKAEVAGVLERATFQVIESDRQTSGDTVAAGRQLVAWEAKFPASELAGKALHNAAIYLTDGGAGEEAMALRVRLMADARFGPEWTHGFSNMAALAYAYEQVADFENASLWYERLVDHYADQPEHGEVVASALHSAAVFRDAMGQTDASTANYQRFGTLFPEDARAPDAWLTRARILEDAGRLEEAAEGFRVFYLSFGDAEPQYRFFAMLHHGRSLEQLGDVSEASAVYERLSAAYRSHLDGGGASGAHTAFAAESMFHVADRRYQTYDAIAFIGLEASMSQRQQNRFLADAMGQKTRGLADLERDYVEVVQTGDAEWGIAALVRLGQAYESMASSLRDSDRPTYLTAEQLKDYNGLMSDRIYVQEEKSGQVYLAAIEKAASLQMTSGYTDLARQRLAIVRPELMLGIPEILGEPLLDGAETPAVEVSL